MNKDELIELSKNANEFLKRVCPLLRDSNNNREVLDLASDLCNKEQLDLIGILLTDIDDNERFDGYYRGRLIEETLPNIRMTLENACRLMNYCRERDIHISSTAFRNFEKNLIIKNHRTIKSTSIIKWIISNKNISENLILPILISKKTTNEKNIAYFLSTLLNSGNNSLIFRCLQYLNSNSCDSPTIFNCLIYIVENSTAKEIIEMSISALINNQGTQENIDDYLVSLCKEKINEESNFFIETFYNQRKKMGSALYDFIFEKICTCTIINDKNTAYLNLLLYNLINEKNTLAVIKLLDHIGSKKENISEICNLSSITHEILNKEEIFKELVLQWFSEDREELFYIIDEIQNKIADFNNYKFKNNDINLDKISQSGFEKIIHRCCGWFFFRPKLAFEFIFRLYEKQTKENREHTLTKVVEVFLENFPINLEEFLEEHSGYELSKDILGIVSERKKLVEESWSISELKLSSDITTEFERERRKMMEAVYKEAQEKSIFSQIASPLHILYGRGSIYYVENPDTPPLRQESIMGTIEHSFENPGMMVRDPIGLELMIINLKYGERK